MSYVDLHLHLLPGVDDGAADEAAALASRPPARRRGRPRRHGTPHINHYWPLEVASIPERVDALARGAARARHRRPRAPGRRARRAPRARALSDAELELIAQGRRGQPLAARRGAVPRPRRRVRRPTAPRSPTRGFGAVIAHPERAAGAGEPDAIATLRVAARRGRRRAGQRLLAARQQRPRRSRRPRSHLLRNGLAYVIASDGHPGHARAHAGARLRARRARRRVVGPGVAADPGEPALPARRTGSPPAPAARALDERAAAPTRPPSARRTPSPRARRRGRSKAAYAPGSPVEPEAPAERGPRARPAGHHWSRARCEVVRLAARIIVRARRAGA